MWIVSGLNCAFEWTNIVTMCKVATDVSVTAQLCNNAQSWNTSPMTLFTTFHYAQLLTHLLQFCALLQCWCLQMRSWALTQFTSCHFAHLLTHTILHIFVNKIHFLQHLHILSHEMHFTILFYLIWFDLISFIYIDMRAHPHNRKCAHMHESQPHCAPACLLFHWGVPSWNTKILQHYNNAF